MVDTRDFKNGGYCHAPGTVKDWPHCDADGCGETPAYEFYPSEWLRPGDTDEETFWYYICRDHLESIVGQIEE